MSYSELTILLPCHALDDFPLYHQGEDAGALLAAWSAPWHPALLAHYDKLPGWARCDDPPEDPAGRLLILPAAHGCDLPSGYSRKVREAGGMLLRKLTDRAELTAAVLAAVNLPAAATIDAATVADFQALGSCWLWTELLTRRMRYMTLLDEVRFQNAALAAARAAVEGDTATLAVELQQAFDQLLQARNHFYPVDCYWLDLVVLDQTTIGPALREELHGTTPVNIVTDSATLNELSRRDPSTLALLRERITAGTAALLAGTQDQGEYALWDVERIAGDLRAGRDAAIAATGAAPAGFARRRDGLTPLLPQLLQPLGYQSAWHVTLDEGRFPTGANSRTAWQGWGGVTLETLARVPLQAGDPGALLALPEKLGETMDRDHTALLTWVRRPGEASPYYRDLLRAARFAPALGRFVTWNELFRETGGAADTQAWTVDDYRAGYLLCDVIRDVPNPLSRHTCAKLHEQQTVAMLHALAALTTGQSTKLAQSADDCATAGEALARAMGFTPNQTGNELLLLNPTPGTLRSLVSWPAAQPLPAVSAPVLAAARTTDGAGEVLVEIPGNGFARLASGAADPSPQTTTRGWFRQAPAAIPSIVQVTERKLVNEFCELTLNADTGGIASIIDGRTRGNRLSQQLSLRIGDGITTQHWDELPDYAIPRVEELIPTLQSELRGRWTARIALLDKNGQQLARVTQHITMTRLSPLIELDLEWEPLTALRAEPWKSYLALRWAWGDEFTELYRSVHETLHRTDAKRIEAPTAIELRDPKRTTALLVNGLPYHQRVGTRRFDTMLAVKGESVTRRRVGILLDPADSIRAARWFAREPVMVSGRGPAGFTHGWLLHVDRKGVLLTALTPITRDGAVIGARMHLLETLGQAGPVIVRGMRPWREAAKYDGHGEPTEQLETNQEQLRLHLAAYEWTMIEARWA